jgi:hypothetical protein
MGIILMGTYKNSYFAMPQLRWLLASFPLQQPGFDPRSGHVGFVVDKLVLVVSIL